MTPPEADLTRDESFPPAARLRRPEEFRSVFRDGKRVGGRYLVVHALLREEGPSRLGLAVSRKVGRAIVRNRVRRRLREIFRRRLRHEIENEGMTFDLVLRALPAAAGRPEHELEADLRQAWKRVLPRLRRRRESAE
ncbi:MAG: ribonuclease P protein component [Acidobacteriota bacterium]